MSGQQIENGGKNPPLVNLPPVVIGLALLLLAVHLGLNLAGQAWQDRAVNALAFDTLLPQRWWTFLTYGLLHADWFHVGSNVLWLAIFSKPVEMHLGPVRYLLLFVISVIGGAAAALLIHFGVEEVLVGASAGVTGVLAAAIPVMYGAADELHGGIAPLRPLGILRDRRALTFTLMWLGLTLLTASSQFFTGRDALTQHPVAWDAHLGGFFIGLILFYLLNSGIKRKPLHTVH